MPAGACRVRAVLPGAFRMLACPAGANLRRRQRSGVRAQVLTGLQTRADTAGPITWGVSADAAVCRARQYAAGARRDGQQQEQPPGGRCPGPLAGPERHLLRAHPHPRTRHCGSGGSPRRVRAAARPTRRRAGLRGLWRAGLRASTRRWSCAGMPAGPRALTSFSVGADDPAERGATPSAGHGGKRCGMLPVGPGGCLYVLRQACGQLWPGDRSSSWGMRLSGRARDDEWVGGGLG